MPKCGKCKKELKLEDVGTNYHYDDWTGTITYYEDEELCGNCRPVFNKNNPN